MVGNVGAGKTTIFRFLKRESEAQPHETGAEDRNFRDSCTKTFELHNKEAFKVEPPAVITY